MRHEYAHLLQDRFPWKDWERLIQNNGVTIDRPRGAVHPVHADIIYPIDYGYVNGTTSTDGEEVDLFKGSTSNGLIGLIATMDHRKGDREIKLLFDCSPIEIYLVNGFINFDRRLMDGALVLRRPMHELW
jgi:hypothetical protein